MIINHSCTGDLCVPVDRRQREVSQKVNSALTHASSSDCTEELPPIISGSMSNKTSMVPNCVAYMRRCLRNLNSQVPGMVLAANTYKGFLTASTDPENKEPLKQYVPHVQHLERTPPNVK